MNPATSQVNCSIFLNLLVCRKAAIADVNVKRLIGKLYFADF